MQRYVLMLSGFCALAVLAILFLLPSPTVRFEGELAMMEPDDALVRLNRASDATEFSDNLSLTHADLAMMSGDMATARRALVRLSGVKPLTALVQDDLAEIARINGDLSGAITHLTAAYADTPTPERRKALGLYHRIGQNKAAEITVLQSVPPRRLSDWEVIRLADLLSSTRQFEPLEALYRVVAAGETKVADAFKMRLVDFLVETGRPDDAAAVALIWYRDADYDQAPLDIAVPVLIGRGAIAQAAALALRALQSSPDTGHSMILTFAKSGHRAIALELQRRNLARSLVVSNEEWATYTVMAEMTGDLRGLRQALSSRTQSRIEEDVLIPVLMQFLRYQGAGALTPYRALLTPALLRKAPLIGAAWARAHHRTAEAYADLVSAAQQPLSDWDKDIWVYTANTLRGTDAFAGLLGGAVQDPRLLDALRGSFIARLDPASIPN
ncbi:tetratricopeptide repeat protein [Pseudogemmobacter sp. W21_MBD1_M6]|uniref:tetratricopeptide repeat protein n=1 Tax=Pseudogemmobacter sp. W21_MBD1_M6 TaxID=3240271 RepID=UPI003F9471FB